MTTAKACLIWIALAAPSLALAQAHPAAPSAGAPNPFGGLWTSWSAVNRESVAAETEAVERIRRDLANAERSAELRNQGRALGERVGEIVRLGDCAEGERVARLAGDFALVAAVRAHCAQADAQPSQRP